jgi:hypothetical protein
MSQLRAFSAFRPLLVGGGWVVDDSTFRLLVDFEVKKAQRLRYCVSLVCLAAEAARPETQGASPPFRAEIVTRYIRGTDVVTPWAQASLALLLIDAETSSLRRILDRLTARLDASVWSAGGSSYPKTATRADELLHQAVDLMVRAKQEGGSRLYVAS